MAITIHRALTELKTNKERISKELESAKFVGFRVGKTKIVNGVSIDEFSKRAMASYDRIVGLIDRHNSIKRAIVLSNAGVANIDGVRKINVCGKQMTVAEAIERKTSIAFDEHLLLSMSSQFSLVTNQIENGNRMVSARLDDYLKSMFGGDKSNASPEEIETHSKSFHENNDYVMVDPISIFKKIESLRFEIENFKMEVDSVLSENNAITIIDV